MVTFIAHIRKDTEERVANLSIVMSHYRKIAPNCKFIIVEDDVLKNFECLSNDKDVEYYHLFNDGAYNKCSGYNFGLSKCKDDIVCFIDIDCIISDSNLIQSIQTVIDTNSICIGYNGTCIYFNYNVKNELMHIHNENVEIYDWLRKFVDCDKLTLLYTNEHYHVANLKAVGGSLFGKRETFMKIGGFNPNFIGWGYEDNEIIHRANKLGISICYVNTEKPYLFHLPHIKEENKNKENTHAFFGNNEKEFSKILNMTKYELEEYIHKW